MKPEQREQFTDEVMNQACNLFDLDGSSLVSLDGFENLVMLANSGGIEYVLRLTHSDHRIPGQVQAELDWLAYLAENDIAVCRPLRSVAGSLTEVIEIDKAQITAVVFEKAKGGLVKRESWTDRMTFNRGKVLGQMHRLTKNYLPASKEITRLQWYEEDDFVNFKTYLPKNRILIRDRFIELIDSIRSIPTDIDSYGLIHSDAHHGNMFFDGDDLTMFDFDDSSYDFFISDIAIALFYSTLMLPADLNQKEFASEFLTIFLDGYKTENSLDNCWLELIPKILKRREIVLYVAINRGFDINNLDDWCTKYLSEKMPRIEKRQPVLDLEWSSFSLS